MAKPKVPKSVKYGPTYWFSVEQLATRCEISSPCALARINRHVASNQRRRNGGGIQINEDAFEMLVFYHDQGGGRQPNLKDDYRRHLKSVAWAKAEAAKAAEESIPSVTTDQLMAAAATPTPPATVTTVATINPPESTELVYIQCGIPKAVHDQFVQHGIDPSTIATAVVVHHFGTPPKP